MRFFYGKKYLGITYLLVMVGILTVLAVNLRGQEKDSEGTYINGNEQVQETFSERKEDQVYVSGKVVGIYEKSQGVLVLDTETICDKDGNECAPSKNKIHAGDYIHGVNGTTIHSKKELLQEVEEFDGSRISLTVIRGGKEKTAEIDPVSVGGGEYKLGIWVKDDMAGIGTITYYTGDGKFGALGHGIGDGTTGELLTVEEGAIYNLNLTGIEKGKRGAPGELEGEIIYNKSNHLGSLHNNGELGIYGILDQQELEQYRALDKLYPVGRKENIKEKGGDTYIYSDVSGQMEKYQVEIEKVDLNAWDTNKGIVLKVTDRRLIGLTGGIVQGMSGSPIVQDGKIIGAVTHVLVNDPTKGYGIFIETMLGDK